MGPYFRPHPRYHGRRGAAHNPPKSWNSVRRNFSAVTAFSAKKGTVRYYYFPENFLRGGDAPAAALEGPDGNDHHERRKSLSFGFGMVEQNDWVVGENGLYPREKHASVGGLLGGSLGGVDMRSRPVPNRLRMDAIRSGRVGGGGSKGVRSAGRQALVAPTSALDTSWGVYKLEAPVVSSTRPGAGDQVVGMAPPAVLVVPSGAGYYASGTGHPRKRAMLDGRWVLMEWQLRAQWGTMAVPGSDDEFAVAAAPAGGVIGSLSASAKSDGSTSVRTEADVPGDGSISSAAKPTPSSLTGDQSTLPEDEPAFASGGKATSTGKNKPITSVSNKPTYARRQDGGTPAAERGSSNNVVEEVDLERYLGGTDEQIDEGGRGFRIHERFLAQLGRWSSYFVGKRAFPLTSVLYDEYYARRNKRHQQREGGGRGSGGSIDAETNAGDSGRTKDRKNGLGKSSSVSYSKRRHVWRSGSASEAKDDSVVAEFLEKATATATTPTAAAVEDASPWAGRGRTGSAAGGRGDGGVFASGGRESDRRSDFSAAATAAAVAVDRRRRRRLVGGGNGGGSGVQGTVWPVWVATVDGWWRSAIAFFPVVPGTDGLLSGEVINLCMYLYL